MGRIYFVSISVLILSTRTKTAAAAAAASAAAFVVTQPHHHHHHRPLHPLDKRRRRAISAAVPTPSRQAFNAVKLHAAANDKKDNIDDSSLRHVIVDDDDISQHEYDHNCNDVANEYSSSSLSSVQSKSNKSITGSKDGGGGGGGYRPIEEWHAETERQSKSQQRVLQRLEGEQARWSRKFESLGGDGI